MPSPGFLLRNAALAREPVIVVDFRTRGGTPQLAYQSGRTSLYGPALLADVSSIPGRWRLDTLTTEIGEVTAEIVATRNGTYRGLNGQGWRGILEADTILSGPKRTDILTVRYGFTGLALSEYVTAFVGVVVGMPRMDGVAYRVTATDGADLLRRVRREQLGALVTSTRLSRWSSVPPLTVATELVSGLLVAATGDPLDALYGVFGYPGDPPGGFVRDLPENVAWPATDGPWMRAMLADLVVGGDPKDVATRALLAPFCCFLRRDASGLWVVADIRPQDKAPEDLPNATPFRTRATLGDGSIVTASMSYDRARHVTAIECRFGLEVWDYWGDFGENAPNGKAIAYRSPQMGRYRLFHRFEAFPAFTEPGSIDDAGEGRVVAVDCPLAYPLEADPPIGDVLTERDDQGEIVFPPVSGPGGVYWDTYEPIDPYGFPTTYKAARVEWSLPGPDAEPYLVMGPANGSNAIRSRFDEIHRLNASMVRVLRAGWLPHVEVRLSVQGRVGAIVGLGDAVTIATSHLPAPARRDLGYDGMGEALEGQVIERSLDTIRGAVDLVVALPLPPTAANAFPRYQLQTALGRSGGAIHQGTARLASPAIANPLDLSIGAWHQIGRDGEPWIDDPIYGRRFHYFRYRLTLDLDPDVWHPTNHWWMCRYRESILSDNSIHPTQAALAVLHSRVRTVIVDDTLAPVTVWDSMCVPGIQGFRAPAFDALQGVGFLGTFFENVDPTFATVSLSDPVAPLAVGDRLLVSLYDFTWTTHVLEKMSDTLWKIEPINDFAYGFEYSFDVYRPVAVADEAGHDFAYLSPTPDRIGDSPQWAQPGVWGLKLDWIACYSFDPVANPTARIFTAAGEPVSGATARSVAARTEIRLDEIRCMRHRFSFETVTQGPPRDWVEHGVER